MTSRSTRNADNSSHIASHSNTRAFHVTRQCKSQIVIPARLASSRLPEKLLLSATGKSVLQHTYEAACQARLPEGVVVAVDCTRLQQEVEDFGGRAILTSDQLTSGTDRVAEVARALPDVELFINVQGDEPEIAPDSIDQVTRLLQSSPNSQIATLAAPIRDRQHLLDPACVKVVCDNLGKAHYFSRSPIPHARTWDDGLLHSDPPLFLQHLGIYAYRREFLLQLADLPTSSLESTEKLEQLRFLQAGFDIEVGVVEHAASGIDTQADYEAFVQRFRTAA